MKIHLSFHTVCGIVLICMRPLSCMVIKNKKELKALEQRAVLKSQ